MGGIDSRDDETYLADLRRLKNTLLSLLDHKKPEKKIPPVRTGKLIDVSPAPGTQRAERPRSKLRKILEGRGRDVRLLSDLPDHELVRVAKSSGFTLNRRELAEVKKNFGDKTADQIVAAIGETYGNS